MYIRIISDLHIDVNDDVPFDMKSRSNVFTIVAGDTSGNPLTSIEWISQNLSSGIIISGNHIVYNRRFLPIEKLKQEFQKAFPVLNSLSYLDISVNDFRKEISNNIFVLGSTLYTNCELGSNDRNKDMVVNRNSMNMQMGLNDFNYGFTNRDGHDRRIIARDYIDWFDETIEAFDKELEANESRRNPKDCIVVTHFCPSRKFIADRYRHSSLNPAYVSDLEWFIEKHPSIKAWICGHIHSRIKNEIVRDDGSRCVLVSNPRGYCFYGESDGWSPDVFLDTDTWEIFTNKTF